MGWEFSTDPEYQEKLDWARRFVEEEVSALELAAPHHHHTPPEPWLRAVVDPMKKEVRAHGLWACHLGPELGGAGYGQVKLALLNEILGAWSWAPTIFGCQGPDTGNAEIIAHYGTDEQKAEYLSPLLEGELFSCFSMTEPQGGADPRQFCTTARRDGDEWILNGEKYFSSNADKASFFIVMAVSSADVDAVRGMSMFLVPADTPGIQILRPTMYMGEIPGEELTHAHVRYADVRIPATALLGGEGNAFVVAQTRLGGGRVHHSMRAVGVATRAYDMMCERALSRTTQGSLLADKAEVQDAIGRSWTEIQSYRLLVLQTAWQIDQAVDRGGHSALRAEVAAIKNAGARLVHDVVERAVHIHGALGVSNEMPLAQMWQMAPAFGLWDGPTEVHAHTLARQLLKRHSPAPGLWPTAWLPAARQRAAEKLAGMLAAKAAWEAEHPPPAPDELGGIGAWQRYRARQAPAAVS